MFSEKCGGVPRTRMNANLVTDRCARALITAVAYSEVLGSSDSGVGPRQGFSLFVSSAKCWDTQTMAV
jgi:hypothetical protein